MIRSARGFTLIELVVVVAIVAILAAIALPSYLDQVQRTRRTEAKRSLHQIALMQQRFYTNCNRYAGSLAGAQSDCSGLGLELPVESENGHYTIQMDVLAGGGWLLRALPQGPQAQDLRCAELQIGHQGQQGASGNEPDTCW